MKAHIALLPGDGIGPEVTAEALRGLEQIGRRFGHSWRVDAAPVGAVAIERTGMPLPPATLALADRRCDAVRRDRQAALGRPRAKVRPEQGLLQLRQELGLFANLRPVACIRRCWMPRRCARAAQGRRPW